jgi:hypothetical protein
MPKLLGLALIALVFAVCIVQILYAKQLLRAQARAANEAPVPIRKIYAALAFAPLGNLLQIRVARVTAAIVACAALVAFFTVLILAK